MSKVTGSKPSSPKKSGSPLLAGILMGMVVGVALAAGLAWFILKSPSPFVNKEVATRPAAEVSIVDVARPESVKPKVDVAAVSSVDEAKPRFEFYKVLTDKPDAADAQLKPAEKPKAEEFKSVPKFLQAGSFASATDAENLKATLAMKGMEASVQKVTIPGRGEMHRVRIGPFTSEQELNSARGTLKLNGLDATPAR
ncbi:SPOR domain-containing protein [Gallionella capsiferriformans]|uniref:Sporulation domain-containing protein n=1 Tax=Gallionella capsiferriformans (strain ES-2) TaxID=395494 RepID=D9SIG9_GALCS|nr:SPOR domain-containing protein [Gallionella capsiferriformans]ADL54226.1 Sporulation domain-containing protein [Gallionella capsiferriformans ES-2]